MLRLKCMALALGLLFIPASSYACFGTEQLNPTRFAEPEFVFEGRLESVSPLRFKIYDVIRGELDQSEITVGVINGGGNRWSPRDFDDFVQKYGEIVRMGVSSGALSCGPECSSGYYVDAICAEPYILPIDSTRDAPDGDITQILMQHGEYQRRLSDVIAELNKLFPNIVVYDLRNTADIREELLTAAMLLGNVKPPADSDLFSVILKRELTRDESRYLLNGRAVISPTELRYNTTGFYTFIEQVLTAFEGPARERYLAKSGFPSPANVPPHGPQSQSQSQSQPERVPPFSITPQGVVMDAKGAVVGKVVANGDVVTLEGVVIGRVRQPEK